MSSSSSSSWATDVVDACARTGGLLLQGVSAAARGDDSRLPHGDVVVPVVMPSARGPRGAGWRLAADAGLHHLSDRHVRQTIEQAQRFGSFRENETLRCAPRARRRPPRGGFH